MRDAESPVDEMRAAPLTERHRPLFFVAFNAVYLLVVSIFPFVMPHVLPSAAVYSALMVYLNAMTLVQEILSLGMGRGLGQLAIQTPQRELPDRLGPALRGAVVALALKLAFGALLMTVAFGLRPGWFDGSTAIAAALGLGVLAGVARVPTQALLYGTRHYAWFLGLDMFWAVARIAIVPLGWRLAGAAGAIAGVALLLAITALPAFVVLPREGIRPRGGLGAGLRALLYFWRFGFWLQFEKLAGSLLRPTVILLLAARLGKEAPACGFMHIALSLFFLVTVSLDGLFQGLYPEKAAAGAAARMGALSRLMSYAAAEARALAALLAPLAWLGLVLAPLAGHLLPPKYSGVVPLLQVVLLALPARGMAAPFVIALQAVHRPGSAALWQWARYAVVLTGVLTGLWAFPTHALAPVWGVVAGEWAATLALTVWGAGASGRRRGRVLVHPAVVALLALGASLGLYAAAPGRHPFIFLAFLCTWPILCTIMRLVTRQEITALFRPHAAEQVP